MPRKMMALGDSVVWGQGLKERHKFVQKTRALLGADTELASFAHSGAVIDLAPQPPQTFTQFLFGELPRGLPGILSQLRIAAGDAAFAPCLQPNSWDLEDWRRVKRDLRQQVAGYATTPPDLILLDGGINDLGAFQIVVPWNLHDSGAVASMSAAFDQAQVAAEAPEPASAAPSVPLSLPIALPNVQWLTDDEFRKLIDQFVFERMRLLLRAIGPMQRFERSRVVVTGYFPIFTEGSIQNLLALNPAIATLLVPSGNRDQQRAALATALSSEVDPREYANLVIHRSKIWYEHSSQRLQQAVDEANRDFGNRFALAVPEFGPDNGALAPRSFLWTFTPAVDGLLRKILRLLDPVSPAAEAADAADAPAAGVFGGTDFAFGYGLGSGIATDEATSSRGDASFAYYVFSSTGRSDPGATFFGGFKTSVASAGHPNRLGVQAYMDAIQKIVP